MEKEKEKALRAKEKADAEKRKKEEGELFKPVQVAQKVPFGVGTLHLSAAQNDVLIIKYPDPKTVLCVYFKAGNCDKGNKCKFSHDRNVERKQEKKDIYSDARDDKVNGQFSLKFRYPTDLTWRFRPQIPWTHGIRRSYKALSFPNMEIQGRRRM